MKADDISNKRIYKLREYIARQQLRKQQKDAHKSNHRHNWKDGRRERIFGSQYHVHCAVKNCAEFKVLH